MRDHDPQRTFVRPIGSADQATMATAKPNPLFLRTTDENILIFSSIGIYEPTKNIGDNNNMNRKERTEELESEESVTK